MAHFVSCKYCGDRFDRDREPAVEVSPRRYAHKRCAEKVDATIPQDEKDYNNLELYIKKIFNTNNINAKIKKQIHEFRQEYGYTYTGMLKTLYWWYGVQNHTTELAQEGIGIIPFVYSDAEQYFYTLYMAKILNDNIIEYKPKVEEIWIDPPEKKPHKVKLFDLDK